MRSQVLIVGAGPVGLTLAIDLGRRGVRCVLAERHAAPQGLPKMERCNARTMEIYRRLGLADRIRAAGLPGDVPMDVFIVTKLTEEPILRLPYPSVNELKREIAEATDGSLPLEPYQLVSQYTLEPLLKAVVEAEPHVDVRFGHELVAFAEVGDGVTATLRQADGTTLEVEADYMVGCDGGGSFVRRQLGIDLSGDANIMQLRQALFRCDDLFERIPIGPGRHYHVADPKHTFLIVQDDTKHFSLHAVVERDEDMAETFRRIVDMPVDFETLYVGKWTQHLLVADRYRDGRVFVAGDAAHLVIPTGGLGMNTGVGDAIDLSWKLAATLQGWGGPDLLNSYEAERRPVGARNVDASRRASKGRRAWRAAWRPEINEDTPEGAKAREDLRQVADVEQRWSNEMIGAELGYRYDRSPVVADEAGEPPPDDPLRYHPTTWPGARLPHAWLADGTAMQDRLGSGYTLLRLGGTAADTGALEQAMRASGAPFAVVTVPDAAARAVYERDLLLLRPDLHVAWRGDGPPADPEALARRVTGHLPA